MPTPPLDEPTTKVTLNFYTTDITWAKSHWGSGWTGEIRNLLRDYRRKKVTTSPIPEKFRNAK